MKEGRALENPRGSELERLVTEKVGLGGQAEDNVGRMDKGTTREHASLELGDDPGKIPLAASQWSYTPPRSTHTSHTIPHPPAILSRLEALCRVA